MKHGKVIMNWSEPKAWYQAARDIAKEEGLSTFPWLSWSGILLLVGGLLVWKWTDADPATRVGIPKLAVITTMLFGFLTALGYVYVRLNCKVSTAVYERGLLHGSLMTKQWIPWDQIRYFYTDMDCIGADTFRFLSWQREGDDDESFSVLSDAIELERLVELFKINQVAALDG